MGLHEFKPSLVKFTNGVASIVAESGDEVLQGNDLEEATIRVFSKSGTEEIVNYDWDNTEPEIADRIYVSFTTNSDGVIDFEASSNPDELVPARDFNGIMNISKITYLGITYTPYKG